MNITSEFFRMKSGSNGSVVTSWIILMLGLFAIFLNIFVVVIILVHRKIVLKNVFYMLVLHCSVVDIVRASALVAWCLPALNVFPMLIVAYLTHIKSWVVILLRSLNMLTILNLLVFTVNEFIVVRRPLQYRRIRRKRIVLLFVGLSWALSLTFAIGNSLSKNYGSSQAKSVYVLKNRTQSGEVSYESDNSEVTRRTTVNLIYCNETHVKLEGRNSGCIQTNWLARNRQNIDEFHYPFLFALIIVCVTCLVTVFSCYAMILKRIRNFKNCTELKTAADNYSKTCGYNNGVTNKLNPARPKRLSTLLRHKYVLVIGSVLVIDILFLVPYSVIQLLQYICLNSPDGTNNWSAQPRLILQFIIGVHSVLQPFCYFRMEDFRRLAKFKKLPQSKENNTTTNNRAVLFNRHSNDFDLDYTESSSKKCVNETLKSPDVKCVGQRSHRNYLTLQSKI